MVRTNVLATVSLLSTQAGAFRFTDISLEKSPGGRYNMWLVDSLTFSDVQAISGGQDFQPNEWHTDVQSVQSGCYEIETVTGVDSDNQDPEQFNITITNVDPEQVVYALNDGARFSVGGAFCGLTQKYQNANMTGMECLAGRAAAKPQITCRNAAALMAAECADMAPATVKAILADFECDSDDLLPMTAYLLLAPAVNASDPTWQNALLNKLSNVLDLYRDAFGEVILHPFTGYSVVEVQLTAYKTVEHEAVAALLTIGGALSNGLESLPQFEDNALMFATSADGIGLGDLPSDVLDAIENLNKVCANGDAPKVDGTCADNSTPVIVTPAPSPSVTPSPSNPSLRGGSEQCAETDEDCSRGSSNSGLSGGAIAGICIGCVLAAAFIGGVAASHAKKGKAAKAAAPAAAAAKPATTAAVPTAQPVPTA